MGESRQMLILMKGHPGCAKSTVARALARALRCPVIDKDDIRDATLCFDASDAPAPDVLNSLSYDAMWRVVETQLQIGLSVVVDCPLARHSLFQAGSRLAQQCGCSLVIVECVAGDLDEWKRRIEARVRAARGPVSEDTTMFVRSTNSAMENATYLEKSAEVPSCEGNVGLGRESSEPQNVEMDQIESIIGVDRIANNLVEAIPSRDEKARRRWHKPARWEDIDRLLEGYANCYEYATGSTRKLVVDTTAVSAEAAVRGVLNWLRNLDEDNTNLVSSVP